MVSMNNNRIKIAKRIRITRKLIKKTRKLDELVKYRKHLEDLRAVGRLLRKDKVDKEWIKTFER